MNSPASPSHDHERLSLGGVGALDLDLDVFSGPFDLLLTLVLREEVDLLELELAEVVLAYLDHLERSGQLDLESATEFIVLIAALLELKSRLMLSGEEEELLDLEPEQAAEELLARMLDARRYRAAGAHLERLLAAEHGVRFREAPLPAALRRTLLPAPAGSEDPELLGQAIGRMLRMPPAIDVRHIAVRASASPSAGRPARAAAAGQLRLRGGRARRRRMTVAVTLFALLELYKRGEACWEQPECFGEIAISPQASEPSLALAAGASAGAAVSARPEGGPIRENPLRAVPIQAEAHRRSWHARSRRAVPVLRAV
jgi:segregation and condensation protein A